MIVYKLENLINGKCYVGQTRRSLEQRIKEHGKSNMSAAHKEIARRNIKLNSLKNKLEKLFRKRRAIKFPNQ